MPRLGSRVRVSFPAPDNKTSMTPLEYYHKKLASGEILEDAQQLAVMQEFQNIYQQLLTTKPNGLLQKLLKKKPVSGLYIWGEVGIGKTFLLDTFFYSLPFPEKRRIHFYAFMRQVQAELRELQGQKNPLQLIARNWAQKTWVLCFDELIVTDIGDAMVLGELFRALFQQGVCLIFTSNVAPDGLYRNGIQRERFLPAIEQIKQHCRIIHVSIQGDYRANYLSQAQYYWYPVTPQNLQNMTLSFQAFSQDAAVTTEPLCLYDREIKVIKRSENVVWFDFIAICGKPRSHEDYLALVERFDAVFVSGVPVIAAKERDLARSFIRFVDVLYDAKTRLVIMADTAIESLYPAGDLLFEFARTKSRLTQMQSKDWNEKA